jgi:hypothetical protein
MEHTRQAPYYHSYRVPQFGPYPVDEPAKGYKSYRVRSGKSHYNMSKISFGPVEFFFQYWFQQPDQLAVHVIDGGSKKQ